MGSDLPAVLRSAVGAGHLYQGRYKSFLIQDDAYLRNEARTEDEIRAVVTALSVHGRDGHVHLRDRIVQSYAVALRSHPEVVGVIARDLLDWRTWGLRDAVAGVMTADTSLDPSEAWAVRQYLRGARDR